MANINDLLNKPAFVIVLVKRRLKSITERSAFQQPIFGYSTAGKVRPSYFEFKG